MAIESNLKKFIINGLGVKALNPKSFDLEANPVDVSEKVSYLGTPVFSNLEIPSGNYKTLDNETIEFDGIRIDTVLFDVGLEKNIIRTPINGRDGTVKQYISLGDYTVSCQGLIIGASDAGNSGFTVRSTSVVPEEEIRKLVAIMSVPQEIEIYSEFLDFFDISTVVILSASFNQKEGFTDSINFSLSMLSDTPLELK